MNPDPPGFEHAIATYRAAIERQPLRYTSIAASSTPDLERRAYLLHSQSWSPEPRVQPAAWHHDVAIYIPRDARRGRALLVVDNGSRHDGANDLARAEHFTPDTLAAIATRTRTAVVSIGDVPNQPLTFAGDGSARAEDELVARSWALFMQDPAASMTVPLSVPMVAAIARAMTLAARELASLDISRFIVAALSKRAWASWLAALVDPRIDAICAVASDILDTRRVLTHTWRTYGEAWPAAFQPYYAEHIDERLDSDAFAALLRIVDPLQYRDTAYAPRLRIPKYIVNASGDDLFTPDNAGLYYDQLPGSKMLRMVPNAAHHDVGPLSMNSLTAFVERLQNATPLPQIDASLYGSARDTALRLSSSERPLRVVLWQASNPYARDFRRACGIHYQALPVQSPAGNAALQVPISQPDAGWSASFLEATYADGLVATSQTYILGKQMYPGPSATAHCTGQLLPRRER
ncbi:MAG TPA: PhoPQ-activated protein PqaA family protein [Paraburkholderia sp.]|jgi:PhoPQ-activated pathogenicity-related protein|nr:PhoPQ-activated protein PqaA family protein [Paraburkholderia sp.]